MKILIVNGPNLNLLGKREPEIYGNTNFDDFLKGLQLRFKEVELEYFQSNHEGGLIDKLQGADADGIVLNAAAFTHTSIALADTLAAINIPAIEVHISNIFSREPFRHHSHTAAHCKGVISGLGLEGYALAIMYLTNKKHP